MTWDQQLARLRSEQPRVLELEGKTRLAEAYRELCSEFQWKFLLGEGMFTTEPSYSTGTIAVDNGGTAVVLTDGTWDATWENRRISIATRNEVYDITINTSSTGTLSRPWAGEDQTEASYVMFRDKYPLAADCERGDLIFVADADCRRPFPIVSPMDLYEGSTYNLGDVGQPSAIAQIEMTVSGVDDPQTWIQFAPAPDAVYTYPYIYIRRGSNPASGSAKPLWPQQYEDLIWRRAEIDWYDSHPEKFLHPAKRQRYVFRLLACKRKNDGGSEISRIMQKYLGTGFGGYFRNISFSGESPNFGEE